jgi:hypothetical protein
MFSPAIIFPTDLEGAYWLAIGDLNNDSKPDLVVAQAETLVNVLLNDTGSSKGITTTTLQSSTNPSTYGQPVIFTAKVRSASGTPTGTVIFYGGWTRLGSATLANGNASLSVSVVPAGSTKITAIYLGSTGFKSSFSGTLNQVVNVSSTTTSLASSHNPAIPGQKITLTANVAGQYGGLATGTVDFWNGTYLVAWQVPVIDNRATTSMWLGAGIYTIKGNYSGDANNNASTSVLTQYISYLSHTAVVTSGSPTFIGQPVTFTATVTSKHGSIPDGELVTFYDGTYALGSTLLASGIATYTTSALSARAHTIKALYLGDAKFQSSFGFAKQVVLRYPTTIVLTSTPNPST